MKSLVRSARRHWFALVLALAFPLSAAALQKGDAAPDFQVQGASGPMHLSDFKGNTVYLDFWASWCGPCKQSFPWMNEIQAKYKDKGLRILAVNVDKKASDAAKFLERVPAAFAIGFDGAGDVPRIYSVKAMPTSLLIAPDGRVLEVHAGFAEDERAERERGIRKALNLP